MAQWRRNHKTLQVERAWLLFDGDVISTIFWLFFLLRSASNNDFLTCGQLYFFKMTSIVFSEVPNVTFSEMLAITTPEMLAVINSSNTRS